MKKLLAGAAMAILGLTGAAYADGHGNFPDRPIMMMVSYGAGGATDFQARIVTMTAGNEDALAVSDGTGSRHRLTPMATPLPPITFRTLSPNRSKAALSIPQTALNRLPTGDPTRPWLLSARTASSVPCRT